MSNNLAEMNVQNVRKSGRMSQEGHDMMCFDAATTLGHLEVEKKGEHFCVRSPGTEGD